MSAVPTDPDEYERRAAPAHKALDGFFEQLVNELDQADGSFLWWKGQSDWKTLTVLADYLIQSIQGTTDAILSATLAAQIHRQTMYSEQESLKANGLQDNKQARRRRQTITASAEQCIFHLGQALDRLAAGAIIVGGFEITTDVASIYWSTLEQIAASLKAGSVKNQVLAPAGTPGRAAQEALVAPVHGWQQFGEPDWLPWMRATRNTMTHRPVGMKLNVIDGKRLTRLFFREPKLSELQSLAFNTKPPKSLLDAFIAAAAEEILDGLCESTARLIEATVGAMAACWSAREANPAMIVQHGTQWPIVEPNKPGLAFNGYGPSVQIPSGPLAFNPLDFERFTAARMTDDRRADWY